MIRLFIKDHETGKVHEYGTNPHDSLIVHSDGSLSYYNLQTGEGTRLFGAYSFCDKDGNDLVILTAPDEGAPESLQGTTPQTGESPHA